MSNVWRNFGFEDTPYSEEPLENSEDDFKLFTGRKKEAPSFLTQMDRKNGGVNIISGDAGIGKTSFFNVQQFCIVTRRAGFKFILVPCYRRSNLLQDDDERSIVKRIMHNTLGNIEKFCIENNITLPNEIKNIKNWMSHQADKSSFGVTVAGFGGTISYDVPRVDEASLENWRDIFEIVSNACKNDLATEVGGLIICLDNVEEIELNRLSRFLMAFRDTLFVINNIWWVIIGQSNLYSQLVAHDERISERIRGPGIEIPPMTSNEVHELVEKRIKRYRDNINSLNPLSEEIHEHLYNASRGVARFVLQTAEMLVIVIVSEVKENVLSKLNETAAPSTIDEAIDTALKGILFDRRIPDKVAIEKLGEMSVNMLATLQLTEEDVQILEKIGTSKITEDDFTDFGVNSAEEFKSSFLDKLTNKNLLQCRFINGVNNYRLKNYAYLCADLTVFGELRDTIYKQF